MSTVPRRTLETQVLPLLEQEVAMRMASPIFLLVGRVRSCRRFDRPLLSRRCVSRT